MIDFDNCLHIISELPNHVDGLPAEYHAVKDSLADYTQDLLIEDIEADNELRDHFLAYFRKVEEAVGSDIIQSILSPTLSPPVTSPAEPPVHRSDDEEYPAIHGTTDPLAAPAPDQIGLPAYTGTADPLQAPAHESNQSLSATDDTAKAVSIAISATDGNEETPSADISVTDTQGESRVSATDGDKKEADTTVSATDDIPRGMCQNPNCARIYGKHNRVDAFDPNKRADAIYCSPACKDIVSAASRKKTKYRYRNRRLEAEKSKIRAKAYGEQLSL